MADVIKFPMLKKKNNYFCYVTYARQGSKKIDIYMYMHARHDGHGIGFHLT
jgi:predicted GNAT family acetyltransferase